MKKVIALILTLAMMVALAGCNGSADEGRAEIELPKGHATSIRVNYGTGATLKDVDFEYVTETILKVTGANGSVTYYSTEYVISIAVEDEE